MEPLNARRLCPSGISLIINVDNGLYFPLSETSQLLEYILPPINYASELLGEVALLLLFLSLNILLDNTIHIYSNKLCFIYGIKTNHQKQPKKGHLDEPPYFSSCLVYELCMHYKWQGGGKVSLEQHRLENYTICLNNIYY